MPYGILPRHLLPKMQQPLRVIEVMDALTGGPFCIATNRFGLIAEEIAQIYSLMFMYHLVGGKYDFLELVRHIVNGLWNAVDELTKSLTPSKPPRCK